MSSAFQGRSAASAARFGGSEEPPRFSVRRIRDAVQDKFGMFDDFEDGDWLLTAVDIVGYGSRPGHVQNRLRRTMYDLVEQTCVDSRVPWPPGQWREDRGDGLLMALPYRLAQPVIEAFIPYLHAGLRRHNEIAADIAKITMRMAVHAGYVIRDDHALTGEAIVRLSRLLDAPAFRKSVALRQATLGVVASRRLYDDIIRPGRGLIDPNHFNMLPLVNKETTTEGWVRLMYPRLDDLLDLAPTG
jgi:hypothetical protein